MQRWAIILLGYDFDIQYVKTTSFGQADALSRLIMERKNYQNNEEKVLGYIEEEILTILATVAEHMPVSLADIQYESRYDPQIQKIQEFIRRNKWPTQISTDDPLKHFHNKRETLTECSDIILSGNRIVIPSKLRLTILNELHRGHPGITRMKHSFNTTEQTEYGKFSRKFSEGDPVFANSTRTWRKGEILQKIGKVMYTVKVEGMIWRRHINQLKPRCYLDANTHLQYFNLNNNDSRDQTYIQSPTTRPGSERTQRPKRNRMAPLRLIIDPRRKRYEEVRHRS